VGDADPPAWLRRARRIQRARRRLRHLAACGWVCTVTGIALVLAASARVVVAAGAVLLTSGLAAAAVAERRLARLSVAAAPDADDRR
jgi:hypothetical protein